MRIKKSKEESLKAKSTFDSILKIGLNTPPKKKVSKVKAKSKRK